ncbi:MAG: hypothetical protein V4573_15880 [Pseudomonadota bacterium]
MAAALGAIWGALAGLMLAAALSLVRPLTGRDDYLVVHWSAVVLAGSVVFALLGLLFKASVGTWAGQTIAWIFDRMAQRGEPTDGLPWWLQFLFYASLAAMAWWFF